MALNLVMAAAVFLDMAHFLRQVNPSQRNSLFKRSYGEYKRAFDHAFFYLTSGRRRRSETDDTNPQVQGALRRTSEHRY